MCHISSSSRSVGGCAANTTADLAILDPALPLKCLGMVGKDENGRYVLSYLQSLGVDTSRVKIIDDQETSYTDVMTVRSTGERTFFTAQGANAVFGYSDIDYDALDTDLFHIGYALLLDAFDADDEQYGTVMARTLAKVREKGIKTSMDVVSEAGSRFERVVKPSLPHCTYLILNEIESSRVTGIEARRSDGRIDGENIKKICARMFELGVEELVVIHAPEGGWAMHRDGAFCFVPSFSLPEGYIVGTVGAGDAFCAGLLYALYKGIPIAEALEIANASAACNLSSANSVDGMRSIEDVMKLKNQFAKQQGIQ